MVIILRHWFEIWNANGSKLVGCQGLVGERSI